MGKIRLGSGITTATHGYIVPVEEVPVYKDIPSEFTDIPVYVPQVETIYVDRVVEKIIEVIKEVPVEVIRTIEKLVEVPVDRIVEIEKQVERIVEVEKIIEKQIEVVSKDMLLTLSNLESQLEHRNKEVKRLTIIIGVLTILVIIGAIF